VAAACFAAFADLLDTQLAIAFSEDRSAVLHRAYSTSDRTAKRREIP
jgi:hypothetical protein